MRTLVVIAFAETDLSEFISEKMEEIASFIGNRFTNFICANAALAECVLTQQEKLQIVGILRNTETEDKIYPIFIEVDDKFETNSDYINVIAKNK